MIIIIKKYELKQACKSGRAYILFRIDVYFTKYFVAVEIDE